MSSSTLAQALWPVLDLLRERGIALEGILANSGYSEAELRIPNARIPRAAVVSILRAGEHLLRDPVGGFASAQCMDLQTFDMIEYTARASETLRDAIDVVNRLAPIADDSACFRLEARGDVVLWRFELDFPPDVRPQLLQYLFGVLGAAGERVLGQPVPTEEVWLAHARPDPTVVDEYQRHIDAPLRFDAPCDGALLRAEVLGRPLRARDPVLANLLLRTAETELAKVERPTELGAAVTRAIQEELQHGEPSLGRIARRLGTTPDSLRKQLRAGDTNYRTILTRARLDTARSYLARPQLTLTEVAFKLGFRNATSFFRWFKQQTGQTPAEFRKGL